MYTSNLGYSMICFYFRAQNLVCGFEPFLDCFFDVILISPRSIGMGVAKSFLLQLSELLPSSSLDSFREGMISSWPMISVRSVQLMESLRRSVLTFANSRPSGLSLTRFSEVYYVTNVVLFSLAFIGV